MRHPIPFILVVDDNADLLELADFALRRVGFEVATAHRGIDAIECARHRRPDLILLDVMMPGMDGEAVIRELKSDTLLSGIPVIILTAHDGSFAATAAALQGANGYLRKGDVDYGNLAEAVVGFLRPHAAAA